MEIDDVNPVVNQANTAESALNRTTTDTSSTVSIKIKMIESCDVPPSHQLRILKEEKNI